MTTFRLGDFLIQIKNAAMASNREVSVRSTKPLVASAEVLKKLGILSDVENKDGVLKVTLTFHKKKPLLMDLKLISKPGLRVYASSKDLASRKRKSTTLLVSTPRGMMSDREAVKIHQGGEIVAEIT